MMKGTRELYASLSPLPWRSSLKWRVVPLNPQLWQSLGLGLVSLSEQKLIFKGAFFQLDKCLRIKALWAGLTCLGFVLSSFWQVILHYLTIA